MYRFVSWKREMKYDSILIHEKCKEKPPSESINLHKVIRIK